MQWVLAILGVAVIVLGFVVSVNLDIFWPMVVAMIAGIILLAGGIIIDNDKLVAQASAEYNNGIHSEDGGKWELITAYGGGYMSSPSFVYECDKCGKTLETTERFK